MALISRLLQRMRARSTSGTAAIEFAMIAPVFFALMFGIIETGLVFFAGGTLENGAEVAGRMIRTGQVQSANMSQTTFRTQVCNEISIFLKCDASHLQIDVESYSAFANVSYTSPITAQGTLNPNLDAFSPGGPCDIVVVRVFYVWQLYTPFFSNYFSNMGNAQRLLSSAVAFRNEPYSTSSC